MQIYSITINIIPYLTYGYFTGASLTSAETTQLQEVFEETKIPVRLRLTLELLKKELAVCQLQQQLGKEVSAFYSMFLSHKMVSMHNSIFFYFIFLIFQSMHNSKLTIHKSSNF